MRAVESGEGAHCAGGKGRDVADCGPLPEALPVQRPPACLVPRSAGLSTPAPSRQLSSTATTAASSSTARRTPTAGSRRWRLAADNGPSQACLPACLPAWPPACLPARLLEPAGALSALTRTHEAAQHRADPKMGWWWRQRLQKPWAVGAIGRTGSEVGCRLEGRSSCGDGALGCENCETGGVLRNERGGRWGRKGESGALLSKCSLRLLCTSAGTAARVSCGA